MRPEETKRHRIEKIIEKILGDSPTHFSINYFTIKENYDSTEVSCFFEEEEDEGEGKTKKFKFKTEGVINALFHGLLRVYCKKYPSLYNVEFSGFTVNADFDTKKTANGADSEALVILETRSKNRNTMIFRHQGRSINISAARVVFDAVEFYINCERASKKLKSLISEARSRDRYDIAEGYVSQLIEIVNITAFDAGEGD